MIEHLKQIALKIWNIDNTDFWTLILVIGIVLVCIGKKMAGI